MLAHRRLNCTNAIFSTEARSESGENDMRQGDALPTIEKKITQTQVERYADAAGDHNPIHLDADFATGADFAGSKLDGTIAHGMMILASISEMLTVAFGEDWLKNGKLKVRFRAPVYPGETIATYGNVKKIDESDGGSELVCAVGVRKLNGDAVISGDAVVSIARNG